MPFTSLHNYHLGIQSILDHWLKTNQSGEPIVPLRLSGGYTRDSLMADQEKLDLLMLKQLSLDDDVREQARLRDHSVDTLRTRAVQFNRLLRAHNGSLPTKDMTVLMFPIPPVRSHTEKVLTMANNICFHWTKLNAVENAEYPLPLTLLGGFTVEAMQAECTTLAKCVESLIIAKGAASRNRIRRDNFVKDQIRPRLLEYRAVILAYFPKTHPQVRTLPAVYPVNTKPRVKAAE